MSDVQIRYLGHSRLKLGPGGSVIGHGDTIVVENSVAESLKDSANWEILKWTVVRKRKLERGDL